MLPPLQFRMITAWIQLRSSQSDKPTVEIRDGRMWMTVPVARRTQNPGVPAMEPVTATALGFVSSLRQLLCRCPVDGDT